jgi:FkbM family methyltransferase
MSGKISFILGATDHAPMIFSRLDRSEHIIGVGGQLMEYGAYDPIEVGQLGQILMEKRRLYGEGVVAVDCGANVGVHTVEWGRLMRKWGSVLAFEAQERLYYALAGNVALNNLFNVKAVHAAVGNKTGEWMISCPDYNIPSSYGSFELRKSDRNEFIGQTIDYENTTCSVPLMTIDQFQLSRCDLIKIDVERMEEEVIEGAWNTITTHLPLLCIEIIKSDLKTIVKKLQNIGYQSLEFTAGNILAIHEKDEVFPLVNGKKVEV